MALRLLVSASALGATGPAVRAGVRTGAARQLLRRTAPFMGSASKNDQGVIYRVQRTDEEWRELLSPQQYEILRKKGTEYPGTGEYDKFYPKEGHFACAGCGQPLYSAASKFASGCGWPAFDKIVEGAVVTQTDRSLGMTRVEILCGGCGGHLGHVFEGEGFTPTMERHCVNSASVKYVEEALPDAASEAKVLPEAKPKSGGILGNLLKGRKSEADKPSG